MIASSAFAADPPAWGVEAGVNAGKVAISGSDTNDLETGMKAGVAIGAFVSIPVTPMVAIQPEVLFTQKHSSFTGKGSSTGFTATAKFDFVEVPVLVKFDLSAMRTPGFYVVVGPQFSFTTKAVFGDQKFGSSTQPDEDLKAKNTVRSVDLGVIVGAGVTMGQFGVEARYDAGLRNLNTDNDASTFEVKTRTFTVLARWTVK